VSERFRAFVARFSAVVDAHSQDEPRLFAHGTPLLAELVSHDDWLPTQFAQDAPDSYRQYLLYCDARERFSVVSLVWGPGQRTPVHDHTVWGMIGMLRGAELCREYAPPTAGRPMAVLSEHLVQTGQVDQVSPRIGDVHAVFNALSDRPSISIHVYGANIGAVNRHVFEPASGEMQAFVSGYHNTVLPNFWERSAEARAATTNGR
jgi:3-mercaptopropionate dioxygenase